MSVPAAQVQSRMVDSAHPFQRASPDLTPDVATDQPSGALCVNFAGLGTASKPSDQRTRPPESASGSETEEKLDDELNEEPDDNEDKEDRDEVEDRDGCACATGAARAAVHSKLTKKREE
ncbi:hypothetical protein ACUY2Z_04905 [Corynebacterium confusum]